MIRPAKNGGQVLKYVDHHCHSDAAVEDYVGRFADTESEPHRRTMMLDIIRSRVAPLIRRFDPAMVCEDCNTGDTEAKRIVGAPAWFSFSPEEIGWFCDIAPNHPHRVVPERVRRVYEEVFPRYAELRGHAEAIISWARAAGETGVAHGTHYQDSYALGVRRF